jgi:hypothetical protein
VVKLKIQKNTSDDFNIFEERSSMTRDDEDFRMEVGDTGKFLSVRLQRVR